MNLTEEIRSSHAQWEESPDSYESSFSGKRAKSKIRLQLASMAAFDGKSMEDVLSMCVERIENESGIWVYPGFGRWLLEE